MTKDDLVSNLGVIAKSGSKVGKQINSDALYDHLISL